MYRSRSSFDDPRCIRVDFKNSQVFSESREQPSNYRQAHWRTSWRAQFSTSFIYNLVSCHEMAPLYVTMDPPMPPRTDRSYLVILFNFGFQILNSPRTAVDSGVSDRRKSTNPNCSRPTKSALPSVMSSRAVSLRSGGLLRLDLKLAVLTLDGGRLHQAITTFRLA